MAAQLNPPQLTRAQDWPERLAEQVALVQAVPYKLGTHDCTRFTCACIEAMTGVDFWPRFAGYKTKTQALRAIARIAPSLGEAVGVVLGASAQPPNLARRGDVLLYEDAGGEHLGVCLGAVGAVLGPQGLIHQRLDHPGFKSSWRVG